MKANISFLMTLILFGLGSYCGLTGLLTDTQAIVWICSTFITGCSLTGYFVYIEIREV